MKQSTKNFILVAGFLLVLMGAYKYSFSKTLEAKHELNKLQAQLEQGSGSLQSIQLLEKKEAYLDSIISTNRSNNSSLQNSLLEVLNEKAGLNSYKIVSFQEPHIQQLENSENTLTSFQFSLEGEYNDIQNVLYSLEKDYSFGSLVHINFERQKDYRLNKSFLRCTVLVQNIQ